jgi:hypothetical protein
MTTQSETIQTRFVDLAAMRYLMAGLTFNLPRCAEVLDHALVGLNDQSGFPDQMCAWIRNGAFASGAPPYDGSARIIIDVTELLKPDGQHLYLAAALRKHDEKEAAPVVFLSMHSPTMDVPVRVEVPLRALLLGNPPIEGTHTLYLHALLADNGQAFIYYGITKRGWGLRFHEHTRAALAQQSERLLARKLRDLIDARAAELAGQADPRPKLSGIITALCSTGLTREMALEAEERMVDKYSLASKHPLGLNMIPGGNAGIARFKKKR